MQKWFWVILLGLGLVFWGISQIYAHREVPSQKMRAFSIAVPDTDTTDVDTSWVDSLEVDTTDTTLWR